MPYRCSVPLYPISYESGHNAAASQQQQSWNQPLKLPTEAKQVDQQQKQ
jgi:hypothetical protein